MGVTEKPTCPKCGAEMPQSALDGHCPRCMARVVFGREERATIQVEPASEAPEDPGKAADLNGQKVGRYKLLEQIGEGGFGVVYMAEQLEPIQRKVAFKVIKAGMDTRAVIARFEAERQALALMDHPNIAKVLDAGTTETGRPYFVMELVRGMPMTAFCDSKHLSPKERLQLFTTVCQAVQHAHQKGIIHRDIKPSNVLVTLHDGKPVPKVIDFGIAKALGQKLTDKTLFTGFSQLMGTPAYMSPEQAEMSGLDVDTRSDIYSLGVLLYELLTSRTPFDPKRLVKAGLDEVRRIIREEDPVRPSTLISGLEPAEQTTMARTRQIEVPKLVRLIRGDLDWIVMKCLEKDRTRRYETANGLALEIERFLNQDPVLARPATVGYKLGKLLRRHRTATIGAACFVLLLTAAAVVSSCLALWATRERLKVTKAHEALKAQADEEEAVLSFMEDYVLAAARPEGQHGGLGREVSVRRAVEAAEPKVSILFSNRPAVEGHIRWALAMTFLDLGNYSNAITQFERAYKLSGEKGAGRRAQDPKLLANLALAYQYAGRSKDALPLFERSVRLARENWGAEHPDTLRMTDNLGLAYGSQGRYEEALSYFEQAYKLQKAQLGTTNEHLLGTMNNLGLCYWRLGRLDQAQQILQQTLDIETSTLGTNHPASLMTLMNLSGVIDQSGFVEKSLSLEETLVERSLTALGPNHPNTLKAMKNLAVGYEKNGRLAEAIPLYEKVLEARKAVLGSEHLDTAKSMSDLANAYGKTNRQAEAENLLRNAIPVLEANLSSDQPLMDAKAQLGWILCNKEQYDGSEPLLLAAYDGYQQIYRSTHLSIISSKLKTTAGRLATLYQAWGKLEQAEEWKKNAAAEQ